MDANEVQQLVNEIEPLLHHRPAAVHASVLCDLVATWLASQREEHRAALILALWRGIDRLLPLYADLIKPETTRQ